MLTSRVTTLNTVDDPFETAVQAVTPAGFVTGPQCAGMFYLSGKPLGGSYVAAMSALKDCGGPSTVGQVRVFVRWPVVNMWLLSAFIGRVESV